MQTITAIKTAKAAMKKNPRTPPTAPPTTADCCGDNTVPGTLVLESIPVGVMEPVGAVGPAGVAGSVLFTGTCAIQKHQML